MDRSTTRCRRICRALALLAAWLVPAAAPAAQTSLSQEQLEALLEFSAAQDGSTLPLPPVLQPEFPPATPLGEGDNTGFSAVSDKLFDFSARNIDIADAMAQLRQLVQRNIIVAPEVEARFTGDLYSVTYLEAIAAITKFANLTAKNEGNFIYIEPAALETRVYPLDNARADDLVRLIQPILSDDGTVSGTSAATTDITSSQENAGGDDYANVDVVVVLDYPQVLEEVEAIIQAVDAAPRQVLVEATILTAELQDGMEAGVNLTGILGGDFADANGFSINGQQAIVGPYDAATMDDGIGTADTGLATGLAQGGLALGFLKDGLGVFLKALQTITNTSVLANTKVVAVNKQRGEVLLGNRDGFLQETTTQTSTVQSVEYLETGTRLIFRPFISSDNTVRLAIHTEDSDGGVNTAGLPEEETAEVTTNVRLRNGETVVIGGLFRERIQTVHKKVPLLGDIPYLGFLFRSRSDITLKEEIIVLLTPHIIEEGADATALTEDLDKALMDEHGRTPFHRTWDMLPSIDRSLLGLAWIDAARALREQGRHASAAILIDAADQMGGHDRMVAPIRAEIWRDFLPGDSSGEIDRRIFEQVRATPHAGRGADA